MPLTEFDKFRSEPGYQPKVKEQARPHNPARPRLFFANPTLPDRSSPYYGLADARARVYAALEAQGYEVLRNDRHGLAAPLQVRWMRQALDGADGGLNLHEQTEIIRNLIHLVDHGILIPASDGLVAVRESPPSLEVHELAAEAQSYGLPAIAIEAGLHEGVDGESRYFHNSFDETLCFAQAGLIEQVAHVVAEHIHRQFRQDIAGTQANRWQRVNGRRLPKKPAQLVTAELFPRMDFSRKLPNFSDPALVQRLTRDYASRRFFPPRQH